MRVEIDVAHVDNAGRVVRIVHRLKPWRTGPLVLRSAWAIELPSGTAHAAGTQVGDEVELISPSISARASPAYMDPDQSGLDSAQPASPDSRGAIA
jgi:hypothetical protein